MKVIKQQERIETCEALESLNYPRIIAKKYKVKQSEFLSVSIGVCTDEIGNTLTKMSRHNQTIFLLSIRCPSPTNSASALFL